MDDEDLSNSDQSVIHEFCFFPLWWKGNYSPLPQQLPQCFRDHSASFRDTHFTYIPSASFREQVFLVFASATTAPLRFPRFLAVSGCGWFHFLSFWPFGPSFPFILAFFFWYVRLPWAWTLSEGIGAGGTVVWACVPSAVLPRSFRAASAKHRSKTGNQTHKT